VLIGGALLLMVTCTALWAAAHWWQFSGTNLAVPIAPGHEIDVTIWKPAFYYSSIDINHTMPLPISGPLTVAIWYQQPASGRTLHPIMLRLPDWPLLVLGASIGAGAIGLWRRRHYLS
jgi:hypothetical protein